MTEPALDPTAFQTQANAIIAAAAMTQAIDLDSFERALALVTDIGPQIDPTNFAATLGLSKLREAAAATREFRDRISVIFADELAGVDRPGYSSG